MAVCLSVVLQFERLILEITFELLDFFLKIVKAESTPRLIKNHQMFVIGRKFEQAIVHSFEVNLKDRDQALPLSLKHAQLNAFLELLIESFIFGDLI